MTTGPMNAPYAQDPSFEHEALEAFRTLLRFDTSNPPGNELAAVQWLAEALRCDGFEPEVLESAPGRGNLVVRMYGDGSKKPLLLSSHVDVVSATETAHWDAPPFAADIKDGVLYGRGTIDMKNMTAMSLATLRALKRSDVPLKRDVIMVACADEESGSDYGSRWLAQYHPEKITAEYVFNEVGAFTLHFGGKRIYPIQIAEKGICWCTITATGTPGHGSIPAPDAALPRLAEAAHKLARTRFPYHHHPVIDDFLKQIAATQQGVVAHMLPLLRVPSLAPFILSLFPDQALARTFDSYLRNTANPTMFHAGSKINVVPGSATMHVDGRVLPGQTSDDFVRELKTVIGDGFEIRVDKFYEGAVSDANDPMMALLTQVIQDHDPGSHVVANMIPGFTDSPIYMALGAKCYGFVPVKLPPDMHFASMYHGHNERIPVDGFLWGLRAFMDAVWRVVT